MRQALIIGVDVTVALGYTRGLRPLEAAKSDAYALAQVLGEREFAVRVLADAQATLANVRTELAAAAQVLRGGDTFLLAFNGHGLAAETPLGFQQSWSLFDRGLVRFGGDGLDAELARFAEGVRVLVIANCCHSAIRTGRTPATPAIRAHVVRIAACGANDVAFDADASRLSPFAAAFIAAAREKEEGDIPTLVARMSSVRPQLEVGQPRSEAFLREGF